MINNIKQVRDFYAQSAKTVSAKNVLKQIEKLNAVLKQAQVQGASESYLYKLSEQGKIAVMNDYRISRAEESAAYKSQLDQLREKYEKDYFTNFQVKQFKQQLFEKKLMAMDDGEIRKLALDFIEDKTDFGGDPAMVDIIFGELKLRSMDESSGLEGMTTAARLKHYDSPWLNSDDGKILTQKIEMLSLPDFAMSDDSGKTYAVGFDDLFDAFDESKDGEGENE